MSKLSAIRSTKADSIATARLSVETSGEGFFEITAEVTRFLKQIGARGSKIDDKVNFRGCIDGKIAGFITS